MSVFVIFIRVHECVSVLRAERSAELIKALLIALPGVSVTDSTVWKHSAAHTASLAPPLSHTHTLG